MKRVLPIAILLTLGAFKSNAQVLIDKQVQMNGSTENDKRVTGLSAPQHLTDAANADAVLHNKLNYAVATGSANNFDVKLLLSPEAYKAGLIINFKSNQDITGAITVNINSVGPKPVFKNLSENLIAGDIKNGQIVSVIYDGAAFQVLSQLAQADNFSGTLNGEVTGTQKNTFIQQGVITTSKIADDAIVTSKISDANVTTSKIADENITTAKVANDAVVTSKIADANITTSKIADGNVTTTKIADVSVTTAKIQSNAVTTEKIADNAVNTFKILDRSVTNEKIDDDAVTNVKIANISITTSKIADGNVTTSKIADANVTTIKIADNAVVTSKIPDANITNAKIANNAITTFKILDANVTTAKIADGNVTNVKVADDAISTSKIIDANVTTVKIANGAVTDAKVANGISYSKLSGAPTSLPPTGAAGGDLTGTYPNPVISSGSINSAKIADGAITNADVNALAAIDYTKLNLSNSIINSDLTSNSITTGKIADGAITTAKITDGTILNADVAPTAAIAYTKLALTNSITNGDLTANTVTTSKIADGSVTTSKIADGSITNADVDATAAIAYGKLNLNNSIQNADLTANSVTTSKVANGTVTTSKMADSAISGLKLLTGAVGTKHISTIGAGSGQVIGYDGTSVMWTTPITSPTGAAGGDLSGTYPNPLIGTGVINSGKIADGAITNIDVNAAAAIAYSKLALTNSIQNGDLTANSVTTSKVANGTVTTSKMADSAISGLKLLTGAVGPKHISNIGATSGQVLGYDGTNVTWTTPSGTPSGAAGGALSGTYPNPSIASGAIGSTQIADGSISNADIATNAITTSKVVDGTVTIAKISATGTATATTFLRGDGSWSTPNIAAGSITNNEVSATAAIAYSKLALTNNIQNGDLTANSVTTSKVANGTVTTSKMADSAISGLKLLTGAVGPKHISTVGASSGQVLGFDGTSIGWSTPNIAAGSITNNEVSATAAIAYSKLNLNNSVNNGDLTANSVTTSKVVNGTVTTSKMADSAVSGLKLLTGAVGPKHISTVGASSGQVLGFDGTNIVWSTPSASGGVPSGVAGGSLSGTYPNPTIATGAIGSAEIADLSVSNGDIAVNAITTSKVANGTVTTSKMADSAISGLKLLTGAVGPKHISTIGASSGQFLGFDGTTIVWSTPSASGGAPSGLAGGSLSGTYPNPTIATGAIGSAEIADLSVSNGDIAVNAITTSKVANGTVTTSKMADSAISGLKLLTGAVGPKHISTIGASTGQVLGYNGSNIAWVTPSSSGTSGTSVTNATVGGTTNITITDPNTRYIIVSFAGSNAGTSTINVTLPAASSYPAGSVICLVPTSYTTANPTWTITSPGSTYNALNNNGVSINSALSIGAINNHRMLTDGVSNWYKLP